jgi:hypothetical protein
MMKFAQRRLSTLLLALVVGVVASSSARASATITIQNVDGASTGFNDPTPASPVGGNNGTTVGQQRLNAFIFAAGIWGATINSGPTIKISASWAALPCDADSGTLGSAGSVGMRRDFPNAPFSSTWYSTALANAISGTDQNGSSAEISAQFNMNVGTPGCVQNTFWYYGLDNNHGSGIDLVTILLHEFAHGLGFQTFTSGGTGSQSGGFPTVYDRFLRDDTTGKLWINMTNSERIASAINTGNLVWAGPQVTADVPNVLTGTPRLRVNSPPALAGNFNIGLAQFGPPLSSPGITANVVGTNPVDGCSAVSGAVSGKIAFIDRGTCTFVQKVKNAQNAGALAVIIGNVSNSTDPTTPPGMGGTDPTITIPSVSLNFADAESFRAQLGNAINASVLLDLSDLAGADSSNRAQMYAPSSFSSGSSVSHWDTAMFPNQLMEPNNSSDLTHSVTLPQDLTFSLLKDIGWSAAGGPPPPPPANDNFSTAQAITGCSGSVNGSNVGATKETGEPNHSPDNNGGTKSVWYQWQAPGTGTATITTAGSGFDTVLGVYTGASVGSLTAIAKNDDNNANDTTSIVTFSATAGTTYMIAVDGYNNAGAGGDVGPITLNWSLTNCGSAAMQIMLEESGPDPNQAAAFDAVLFLRDPFPVVNGGNLFSLPADPNTRVLLFVTNLQLAQGETAAAVTVNLIDSANQTYNISAQDVRSVPNQTFTQVTFRLPNNLAVGTCQIKVIAHGVTSNTATLRIKS